jgi:hypothetical protein
MHSSCLSKIAENTYTCKNKHITFHTASAKVTCCPDDLSVQTPGPGDFLHDAILKWAGEGPSRECGCTDRINKMNAWGPQGCREHLDEIVEWMKEQAKQRDWWKIAVAVPVLPRMFIRQMILGAIEDAESSATAAQSSASREPIP